MLTEEEKEEAGGRRRFSTRPTLLARGRFAETETRNDGKFACAAWVEQIRIGGGKRLWEKREEK